MIFRTEIERFLGISVVFGAAIEVQTRNLDPSEYASCAIGTILAALPSLLCSLLLLLLVEDFVHVDFGVGTQIVPRLSTSD